MQVGNDLRLGILGGGQLGKMLLQPILDLNMSCIILDPDAKAPCAEFASEFYNGKLTDANEVKELGSKVDVLTIEIENVNTEAMEELQKQGLPVYPQPQVVRLIQDKGDQKDHYTKHNIPTAPYTHVADKAALQSMDIEYPKILKLRREGYDGRGVMKLSSPADLEKAFDAPCILEDLIPFEKELAVIVARNTHGETSTFPLVEMEFHPEQNLVEFLFCPAQVDKATEDKAAAVAKQVAESLDIVGILAVEMFLTKDGEILVNEVAPRVHNSGHHTIEGNVTSQFEQHIRAITGLPLGDTRLVQPSVMVNILGEPGFDGPARYEGLNEVMALPGVHVHLYGKKMTRPFRKMGHVTICDPDLQAAKDRARQVQSILKVKS